MSNWTKRVSTPHQRTLRLRTHFVTRMRRQFLVTFVLLLELASPAFSAADLVQLQIPCPVRLDLLTKLYETDLDYVLYGVKIRDWKDEYFDVLAERDEECMRSKHEAESIIKVSRENREQILSRRARYLEARDKNLASSQKKAAASEAVSQANSQGLSIQLSDSGEPQPIRIGFFPGAPKQSVEIKCSDLKRPLLDWYSDVGLRTLGAYAEVCAKSGHLDEEMFKQVTSRQQALLNMYAQVPAFAARVTQLAAQGNSVTAASVAELRTTYKRLLAPIDVPGTSRDVPFYPQLNDANSKLALLEEAVAEKQCISDFANSKLPAEWREAYFAGSRAVGTFKYLVCPAIRRGVQVRPVNSSRIGIFGSEGVEFRGKHVVQVFLELSDIPGNTKGAKQLRPVKATINGKDIKNYAEFEPVLMQTISGQ